MRSAFEVVLQTPKGVLGCDWDSLGQCAVVDPKTLKAAGRFDCEPMSLAGRDSADQEALGKLVATRCQVDIRGRLVALGKRWMMTEEGRWPGPYAVNYRRVENGAGWQSSDLALLRESNVKISAARDEAIIDNKRPELHRFIRLDFTTGTYRTLFQLRDPKGADVAWAVTDQILIVGAGRDLILYDLVNNRMAGVLHNVIAEDTKYNGYGVDHAKIVRLLVDGPRLIALTFDGRYSGVLQMQDVLDYAKRTVQSFNSVDATLLE